MQTNESNNNPNTNQEQVHIQSVHDLTDNESVIVDPGSVDPESDLGQALRVISLDSLTV